MNRECPIAIHCGDSPFQNLSSEGPEIFAWSAVGYCCDSQLKLATSVISQLQANLAMQRLLVSDCPDCNQPQKYCADATCPDGSNLATICVTTSQADAETLAANAEAEMLPNCDTKEQLYEANCACPDGVTDPHTVRSSISQAVAQAQCDFIPKDCPGSVSTPQTCVVKCPDGTTFTFTLAAGTINAPTQEEADAIAKALACAEAEKQKMCLGPLSGCVCVDTPILNARIEITQGARNCTWSISSGALPVNVQLIGQGTYATLSGIPTVHGHYQFTVRATDSNGNYAEKSCDLYVIYLSVSSLPQYTVGQAYSHQMTAAGGSGNYRWSIQSGALPDGLTMSATGLISGTPTGADSGIMPITFGVVDLTCEAQQNSWFPPKATLITTSTTTTRTRHGWFAYGATSGTLYKRFDVSGTHTQTALTSPLVDPVSVGMEYCAGAKETYGGYSAIDLYGNVTHLHEKMLTVDCPQEPYPLVEIPVATGTGDFVWGADQNIQSLLGYCWPDDVESCDTCSSNEADWVSKGNYAQANSYDLPWDMLVELEHVTALSPTVLRYDWTTQSFYDRIVREDLSAPIGFPTGSTNVYFMVEGWVRIRSVGDWTITLSEPYTDLEAELTKTVATGLGAVAHGGTQTHWLTQYIHHVSVRSTSVAFQIHCTNLLIGDDYAVTYELWNLTTNVKTSVTISFNATDASMVQTGTVPTPLFGQSIKIGNVRIRKL